MRLVNDDEYDISADPYEDIPYFKSDRIQFQLIICTAGNALFIARSGELCRKIIRKVSRYYLENAYSLNIAAAVTEKTNDFGNDIFRLYQKLNTIKASSDISDPLGTLAVAIKERNTGEPAVGITEDSGDPYSVSSFIRRKEAMYRDVIVDMKHISDTAAPEGKKYVAVIHADGNNLGITIGRILQKTPDYETGIRRRRQINSSIEKTLPKQWQAQCSSLKHIIMHTVKVKRILHIRSVSFTEPEMTSTVFVTRRWHFLLQSFCTVILPVPCFGIQKS